ncbi:MAG: FAA hydrolase family protein [Burkholderiaceae bacterium]|nr:MAG: FAA hydrolase family protein [Burkholderiaceae bacterium]
MSETVFASIAPATLAVRGSSQRYPVRRIFCVGKNYAAHVREMGGDPAREQPFFFAKSPAHIALSGSTVPYPPGTHNYHHEIELVVAIGKTAWRVAPERALDGIWGYGCGLDMTRRDLQAKAKEAGHPWTFAKDFENAAVLGELVPASAIGHPERGAIELKVNGEQRQHADLNNMIWSVPEIVANLSQHYHLQPGDLIYTGTPSGVGPVVPGNRLSGRIEGVGEIALSIGPAV